MQKIMFNDKHRLTKAALDGNKTQTRRVIKLKDVEYVKVVALDNGSFISYVAKEGKPTAHVGAIDLPNFVRVLEPRYFIGEEVAVAQRYSECFRAVCLTDSKGWDNKMFTKAYLLPHRIKITDIRVERLQDISDEDCIAEGVEECSEPHTIGYPFGVPFRFFASEDKPCNRYSTPREAFAALIDKVSGKGTWDSNPWVFVYDFELIK